MAQAFQVGNNAVQQRFTHAHIFILRQDRQYLYFTDLCFAEAVPDNNTFVQAHVAAEFVLLYAACPGLVSDSQCRQLGGVDRILARFTAQDYAVANVGGLRFSVANVHTRCYLP